MMFPYRDSRFTKVALVIFFLLIIGYAFYEAQGLLFGPSITVYSKEVTVNDPYITISGHAERISSLAMNGRQVAVTEDGDFEEPYLLAEGYNRIVFDAEDKYGRSSRKVMEVIYTASPSDTGNTATQAEIDSTESATSTTLAPEQ